MAHAPQRVVLRAFAVYHCSQSCFHNLASQQCSQNVDVNGPHHGPYQYMASSSLHCHRLVEWGRHNELEASLVGAVYVHVLRTLHHKFKSEVYSRQSLRITWPLFLLIGEGKNGRVLCDKRERQVAINGSCDKRGFTVVSKDIRSLFRTYKTFVSTLKWKSLLWVYLSWYNIKKHFF